VSTRCTLKTAPVFRGCREGTLRPESTEPGLSCQVRGLHAGGQAGKNNVYKGSRACPDCDNADVVTRRALRRDQLTMEIVEKSINHSHTTTHKTPPLN